ncbi:MAG TPA: hypothetical protein VD758_07300, partial [Gemmatimonadaceae bacterium]|nr:hypothetical protein [Gemmatimonadaceae bacterium]
MWCRERKIRGNREADPVDGDGSLMNDVRRQRVRKADPEPVEVGVGAQIVDVPDRVDVSLD